MFREGNKKLFPKGQKAFKLNEKYSQTVSADFFLACSRLMSSGWFIPSFIKGHFSSPAAGHLHLKSQLSVFCLGWNKQVHKCTVQLINEWILQYLIRPSVFLAGTQVFLKQHSPWYYLVLRSPPNSSPSSFSFLPWIVRFHTKSMVKLGLLQYHSHPQKFSPTATWGLSPYLALPNQIRLSPWHILQEWVMNC